MNFKEVGYLNWLSNYSDGFADPYNRGEYYNNYKKKKNNQKQIKWKNIMFQFCPLSTCL